MPANMFITVGSRNDLKLLLWCARTETPVNWTVPSDAEIGEKIYFVVPSRSGPVRAFGFVDDVPQPSTDFGGRYRAMVANIEMLEVAVPLDEIAKRFTAWPYWGNARSYHKVPKEYAREFEQFIEEYQTAPDWKVLDALERTDEIWDELEDEAEESQALADADAIADLESKEPPPQAVGH